MGFLTFYVVPMRVTGHLQDDASDIPTANPGGQSVPGRHISSRRMCSPGFLHPKTSYSSGTVWARGNPNGRTGNRRKEQARLRAGRKSCFMSIGNARSQDTTSLGPGSAPERGLIRKGSRVLFYVTSSRVTDTFWECESDTDGFQPMTNTPRPSTTP